MSLKDEWEYKRLKQILDGLPEDRQEALMADKKKFHSGRGGYRGGVKPKLPDHLKRVPVNARIQKWMIDELKKDGEIGAVLEALILKAGYKMPECQRSLKTEPFSVKSN